MRTIQRIIACGLIESVDGKILMGKKDPSKGGVYIDCWHIPGGGLEENETLEEALCREVFEEVGIDISDASIKLIDSSGTGSTQKILKSGEKVVCSMKFFVYRIKLITNSVDTMVILNDDLVESQWFDRKDLSNLKMVPASVDLFKRLNYIMQTKA